MATIPPAADPVVTPVARPLSDLDHVPPSLPARLVFVLLVSYLFLNRLISDQYVLPIGLSLRPYELVMGILVLAWVVWMIAEPHPFPSGTVAIVGLATLAFLGAAPFVNATGMTSFQANGAERGLVRLFMFSGLFVAAFHLSFRLGYARKLLAWIIGATAGQAMFALYEFLTEKPIELLDNIALAIGLEFDPRTIRPDQLDVEQRITGEVRAVATAPHPIVLSAVMALGVLLSASWLLHARDRREKRWAMVALLCCTVGLPLANSRTAFVILAVAALPLIVLMIKILPRLIPWSLAGALLLSLAFIVSPATPRLLLNSVFGAAEDENTQIRLERFELLDEMLEERPIMGAGYLTHDPRIQIFDNAYNLGLIELGMLGLALMVSLFLVVINWSRKAYQRCTSSRESIVPLAGVVAGIALLTGGATFDAFTFDQFFPTCVTIMGLASGRATVILRRPAASESTALIRAV